MKFLEDYDTNYSPLFAEQAEAMFQKATNITKENSQKQMDADQRVRRKLYTLREGLRKVNYVCYHSGTQELRPFHGDHFTGNISRRPFHGDHFTGIISRGTFHGDHFTGIISRGSIHGTISRGPFHGDH